MPNVLATGENLNVQLRLQPSNRSTPLDVFVALGTAGLQPATLQGSLFVDPGNVSGNAGSGPGFGQSATSPMSNWASLVQQWGTISPFFTQPTTINFLSPHTDNTDPIVFQPFVARGVLPPVITSTPTLVNTVTLSGVVPKSRVAGSNSLLQANLGASATTNMLLENTTHPSRAWTFASLGANNFSLFQPMTKVLPGGNIFGSTEVDTWANGDTVQLLKPLTLNVAYFICYQLDDNGFSANAAYIYQSTVFAPTALEQMYLGGVRLLEASSQRIYAPQAPMVGNLNIHLNSSFIGGLEAEIGGSFGFLAGGLNGSVHSAGAQIALDKDVVLSASANPIFTNAALFVCNFYLDKTAIFQSGSVLGCNLSFSGTGVVYGSAGANLDFRDISSARTNGQTFASTWTAPALVTTGVILNGSSVASTQTGANPDVINTGVATTVANLDAAGVPGAFNLGGASVRH